METTQNEDGKKKLMMGAIIGLLLIIGVTLYFVYSGHQDNSDLTVQKTTLDSTFKNLSDTLDVRSAELEQIADRNTKLDSTVSQKQALIEEERGQISSILKKAKMTKAELEEAKGKIAAYETSISELQVTVAALNQQNQQLTMANGQLTDSLSSEKKTSADLNTQNQGLAQKVQLGSLLQVKEVDVNGVKERQNGKETTVRHAKAVESLRIGFETGTNKLLNNGPLTLYVRIMNPKGETISVADQGSGVFQSATSGAPISYSTKANVSWDQTSKKVTVEWSSNISSPGIYKVEVYQSGHEIGKGETDLK